MLSNLLLLIYIITSSFIFTTHSYNHKCLRHQEIMLLQLKDELIFDSSRSTKLARWNESGECCKWHGVECDASGYVVSLQLNDEAIYGGIGDSSSLFKFKYLQKLNLADNHFDSDTDPIPRGIGNLTYLTHLNLSYAGYGGQVPSEISSLTRLASLDISSDYTLCLEHTNLEMLVHNLTELRELHLDHVYISSLHESKNWGHIISSHLPNLTSLSMVGCFLYAPSPKPFWQLHSLSILQLDQNDLSGVTLHDLFTNFPSLATLTLSSCSLKGSIPSTFVNLTKLIHVDLSHNSFTSSLPSTLFANLTKLIHVDLSLNFLTGSLPSTLFANVTQLIRVDMSHNAFTGALPSTLFEGLSNLVHLNLRRNSFSGNIPQSRSALPSLLELDLSHNHFKGTFQLSLPNLTLLDLSGNSLSIDAGNVNSSSHECLKLKVLHLNSCNLSSFPDFIKHLDLEALDLSKNRITGEIPSWIWGTQLWYLDLSFNLLTNLQKPYYIPASVRVVYLQSNQLRDELHLPISFESELFYLYLADNNLSGSIPTSICNATRLYNLDLSRNKLSGPIPTCLCNATQLNSLSLSGNKLSVINLEEIDLSRNNISGSIPPFPLVRIMVLDLSQNNIIGSIPDIFRTDYFCMLRYLDLSYNTLEGKITKSLEHCMWMVYMNVGNNMINDTFPCMLSSGLAVLVLHSNRFHGQVRCHINWLNLQILDISSNHFSGSLESINFSSWMTMELPSDKRGVTSYKLPSSMTLIVKGQMVDFYKIWKDFSTIDSFYGKLPNAIGDLTSLHHLNFSHNALNGSIPKSFVQLKNLESLDLSVNQLAGSIPEELGGLTFLAHLNLSYNMFVGAIPNGRQIQTFSADSFEGNLGLCGLALDISCSNSNVPPPGYDENGEEKREIQWEYVCAAVGYVVGVGSIVWLLLFCRSFREKYFGKIEEVVENMFIARDMRRRRARRAAAARNRVRRQ
ncbi:receptor-like protein 35 [Salvia splendens]|uniref:receptor-like protein 35 n=1 Tax=Salvia splendens TaxID=180675 RepID=UPI001C25CCA7|nr:receptor-like protein 35 [Salvia splendens]